MQTIQLGLKTHPLCYKVVTEDLKSLGLRNNPTIIEYPLNKWYFLDEEDVERGKHLGRINHKVSDIGGMWAATNLSGAKSLKKYMQEKHNKKTKIFTAALDEVLYYNSYRIKTNGIMLLEELFQDYN